MPKPALPAPPPASNLYQQPLQTLKGIGPSKAALFEKLKLYSVGDLLHLYPRVYEDWHDVVPIAQTVLGEVQVVCGTVLARPTAQRVRGGTTLYKVTVTDGDSDIALTFFNNRYIPSLLQKDQRYFFRGKVSGSLLRREMTAPAFLPEKKQLPLRPIYPQTQGLTSRQIAAAVQEALSQLPTPLADSLPQEIREENQLCSLAFALRHIHFPESDRHLETAKTRLIFEEFLLLQLGLMQLRQGKKTENRHPLPNQFPSAFTSQLPYTLTGAQQRAIADCIADMAGETPMNRLIQGDVGSGKTVIAAALCWAAAKAGLQAALMAPTEILATQHFQVLSPLLTPMGIHVALLTGSSSAAQKREIYEALQVGEIDLIIGTHALLQTGVHFHRLGLVVTDEQHRFGVNQRMTLAEKGHAPHLLVMSATPIPRTLALMIYGDLDISVLDELPPGRQPIETYLIDGKKRHRAYRYVQKHLDEGRQGYFICPLVAEDQNGMVSVMEYANVVKAAFPDVPVATLHGKMKPREKEAAMQSFSAGDTKLLIATTVVEVGVDVPNAVIMIIENAERYGLSQLHQLRGRIGRGRHQSTCILISDTENDQTCARLRDFCKMRDGFAISEADLRLRGPGDFFGSRQHGLPRLKIADMTTDMELLYKAQHCAGAILKSPAWQTPVYQPLRDAVQRLFGRRGDDPIIL